jgi:hypothetical protein
MAAVKSPHLAERSAVTDRASGPCDHRCRNTTAYPTQVWGSEGGKPAEIAPAWRCGSASLGHIWIMGRKDWKGNPDPSRSGAAGIVVVGRDDPGGPPDSAGAGHWRRVVAGAWLGVGRRGYNSLARDRSGGTERNGSCIRGCRKIVVEAPLRRGPPYRFAGGTGHRRQFRGRVEPDCMW